MDPLTAEVRELENDGHKFTYLKLPARPEGVPDKFWNADNGLNLTALNKGYLALESGRSQFMEDTRRALATEFEDKLPKAPPEYAVKVPEIANLPAGFSFDPGSDPVVGMLKAAGKDSNLTQQAFDALVKARAEYRAAEFRSQGERAVKLLGDNASERIGKVRGKLSEVLGKEAGEALAGTVNSPEAVLAIERLVGGGAPGAGGTGSSSVLSEEDLRVRMRDPRYYDPMRRDPAYCKEIEDGFKRLYGDQKFDPAPRFTSA